METMEIDPCSPNPCGNHVECIVIYNESYCRCPSKEEYYRLSNRHIECENKDDAIAIDSSFFSDTSTSNADARTSGNTVTSLIAPTSLPGTTASLLGLGTVAIVVALLLGISCVAIYMTWRSHRRIRLDQEHDIQYNVEGAQSKDGNETSLQATDSSSDDPTSAASDGELHERTKTPYIQHLVDVSKISSFIVISEIFENSLPLTDVTFVAQLGKEDLAAAALATVWFNLWHFSMVGFMSASDTLLAQSFGANDKTSFRAWTGTSLLVVLAVTPLVAGIIALCEPAMKLVGQNPNLAEKAGEFSYRLIPGLFPLYLYKVLVKYLQTQRILRPGVILGFFSCMFNILSNWLFIYGFDLGLNGAPWATTTTRIVQFLMMIGYLYWNKHNVFQMAWSVLSTTSLQCSRLSHFWKLAVSGTLAIAAGAWAFEFTTIMAGLLGTTELDAHIITLSMDSFIFLSVPYSVGTATSIRVGQLIGGGNAPDAQRMVVVVLCLLIVFQVVSSCVVLTCKDWLVQTFSSDPDVADLVATLIPIWCVWMLGDAFQTTFLGAFRGLGRQRLQLILNIIAYWVLAVPIGFVLSFLCDLGVAGLWWGMIIGIYVSSVIATLYFKFMIDWQLEEERARERVSAMSSTNNEMVYESVKGEFPRDSKSTVEDIE